jgi:DNA mismatch repair ATPase MutS
VLLQLSVAGVLLQRIRPRIGQIRQLTESFTVLRQGLELMEVQQFQSTKLRSLVEGVRKQGGAQAVRKLEKLARAFDQRDKHAFQYLSMLLAVGTQLALAVEQWRAEHQHNFESWLDAWADFEALQALATYAYERPGCTFPEFVEGPSLVEAEQLGHPLLEDDVCVCNDVSLNRASRFYLVSGSNMSGKSTFLRTIGLNVVVALAGGPVRATCVRMAHLTVCASLAITDSLIEGRSKFLAEVERVSDTICCVQEGKAVLFLIDEILSGTNSVDRRAAAEGVIRILLAGGAVGALSTHDLALTAIAEDSTSGGVLVHMESDNQDNPLDFDYVVKPGVSRRSSASAILRMMGVFDALSNQD